MLSPHLEQAHCSALYVSVTVLSPPPNTRLLTDGPSPCMSRIFCQLSRSQQPGVPVYAAGHWLEPSSRRPAAAAEGQELTLLQSQSDILRGLYCVQRHWLLLGGTTATAPCTLAGAVQDHRQPSNSVAPGHDLQALVLALPGLHANWNVLDLSIIVQTPGAVLLQLPPSLTENTAVSPHLIVSQTGESRGHPSGFDCGRRGRARACDSARRARSGGSQHTHRRAHAAGNADAVRGCWCACIYTHR